MMSQSQNSTDKLAKLHSRLREQDIINQTQAQLVASLRVAPDEAIDNWQKTSVRLGDWSSNLESEIYHLIW
jgi:hypothetical protein